MTTNKTEQAHDNKTIRPLKPEEDLRLDIKAIVWGIQNGNTSTTTINQLLDTYNRLKPYIDLGIKDSE